MPLCVRAWCVVRRKHAQEAGRKLAAKLKPGDWIAVQDRRTVDPVFPFMIGRVVCADGSNRSRLNDQGCIVKTVSEKETIDGQRFDAGDMVVTVRWCKHCMLQGVLTLWWCRYSRDTADCEGLTFEIAEFGVFNSTELRAGQFKMDKVDAPIPVHVPSCGGADSGGGSDSDDDAPLRNISGLTSQRTLPKAIERNILHECW